MKRTVILSLCIVALACVVRCAKSSSNPIKNLATCTTCPVDPLEQTPDTANLWYYIPTAFTPNGDGVNDVLRFWYSSRVEADSSVITIWDKNGNGVFKGNINQIWDGRDLHGSLCAAGHYPLYMQLMTKTGVHINQCGCVSVLAYKGTCIYTGGIHYVLPDELDTATGFTYPTYDHLCP